MKEHYLVSKHNDLVSSHFNLSLQEMRLIVVATALLQPEDEEFKPIHISIRDYANLVGLDPNSQWTHLEKIITGILSKPLKIQKNTTKGKKILICNWLSSGEINTDGESEGILTLRLDPSLKPYLLQLKETFTSYKLSNVLQLSHKYSYRIYELLKQHQNFGKRDFDLQEFRLMLGLSKSYAEWGNLRKRVLEPALADITANTDITFTYKPKKKGRAVIGLSFQIKKVRRRKREPDVSYERVKAVSKTLGTGKRKKGKLFTPSELEGTDFGIYAKLADDCLENKNYSCEVEWSEAVKNRQAKCYWCTLHGRAREVHLEQNQPLPILDDYPELDEEEMTAVGDTMAKLRRKLGIPDA